MTRAGPTRFAARQAEAVSARPVEVVALELTPLTGWTQLLVQALVATCDHPTGAGRGFDCTETFGVLRFQFMTGDPAFFEQLYALERSSVTVCSVCGVCGVCGDAGRASSHGGWFRTLCVVHQAQHDADTTPPSVVLALYAEARAVSEAAARPDARSHELW